tara:strand:- start:69 stop:380 length:312 start_codon:yes stop_codon:yes gene_type:complete
MVLGKYEFDSKEQAEYKIEKLGVSDECNPIHKHSVVILGHLTLNEGVYSELGEVITEPIKSNGFAVDVLWIGLESHPYGWKSYSIKVNNPKHSFAGIDNETQL